MARHDPHGKEDLGERFSQFASVCGITDGHDLRSANDTPALNALKALRGAPTNMGRGEIPVELMPSAVRSVHFFRYGKGELSLKKDNLLRYSMQLAFLKQLLEKKLISDREYSLIKSRLMKDYKIVSDLLS